MTPEQLEKLKEKYKDYLKYYPEAEFEPWGDPPIGLRVERISGGHTGRVVGRVLAEFNDRPHILNCSTCSCKTPNVFFGWWEIESDDYKDDEGKPEIMIEYPPVWRSWKLAASEGAKP
jgi:hypothetical protein